MKTYNVPVEIEFMPAFQSACDRLKIYHEVKKSSEDYNECEVYLDAPEMLFCLGVQYNFYKGLQLENDRFTSAMSRTKLILSSTIK